MMIVLRDGARLFVQQVKHGQSCHNILFLAGMGAPCDAWSKQMADPPENTHCVAFDARGVGQSTFTGEKNECSVDNAGRDALDVLEAMKWDKTILVGHSLGSFVVQWLLLHHPERVSGAVLISTRAVGGWWHALPSFWGLSLFLRMRLASDPEDAQRFAMRMNYTDDFIASTEGSAVMDILRRRPVSDPIVSKGQLDAAQGHALTDAEMNQIKRLDIPKVVLAGDADVLIGADLSRHAADAFGARFTLLEGVGHGLMMQAHGDVKKAIRSVLENVSSAKS